MHEVTFAFISPEGWAEEREAMCLGGNFKKPGPGHPESGASGLWLLLAPALAAGAVGRLFGVCTVALTSGKHMDLCCFCDLPCFSYRRREHDNECDYTILFDYCFHSASRIGRRSASELRSSFASGHNMYSFL